ncbi:hypothetical protein [Ramlibacter sp.]|uniref:hypothetical protein n=1 Tax=Ramlibacter sp. TaxID=1917967 RepID=UPI00181B44B2|nr:hypothetical protein [Ramlibacter sp.]MBA2676050.1 hypothetical protein [Ramlibacter sp.]
MASRVLYSHEYSREMNQGTLDPDAFDYRFLCEGDSWMDRSSPTQLSLPWALAKTFHGGKGNRALFINLSRFGHTLRRIGDSLNDDFLQWLNTDMGWRFDALLFSAGGNDFIDAALGPPPGKGILRDVRQSQPAGAVDCFDADAVATLVTGYLDPNFEKLHATVRNSRLHGGIPMFLNCYNMPVARNAPAIAGHKAWLFEAYRKNGIPEALWPEVTERLFVDVESAVTGWVKGAPHPGVFAVPTTAVPLVPADPASTGNSGDWLNEIHPNKSGWNKLATAWQAALDQVL